PFQPMTLTEMGKAYLLQGDKLRAIAMLEHSWRILQASGSVNAAPPAEVLQRRRATAFWLSQAYQSAGRFGESRQMGDAAAKLSLKASEVEALSTKAFADPPDKEAAKKLQALFQTP